MLFKQKKLAGYAFKDIGIEAERVFLNENLCPASRRLFYQANMQKKIARWRFIWTQNGKIKLKKDVDSQIITIEEEKDLEKIFTNSERRRSERLSNINAD